MWQRFIIQLHIAPFPSHMHAHTWGKQSAQAATQMCSFCYLIMTHGGEAGGGGGSREGRSAQPCWMHMVAARFCAKWGGPTHMLPMHNANQSSRSRSRSDQVARTWQGWGTPSAPRSPSTASLPTRVSPRCCNYHTPFLLLLFLLCPHLSPVTTPPVTAHTDTTLRIFFQGFHETVAGTSLMRGAKR